MKRKRCQRCETWMRYEKGATSVSCGECGANYTIEQHTRVRGGALQRGIMQALRKGLANDPSACKPCKGTSLTGLQVRSLRRAVERRLEHEGWHIDGEIRHEGRQG